MKNKSIRIRKKLPHNPALDLFGEVPVLISDLHAWVFWAAPRWYGTRRMEEHKGQACIGMKKRAVARLYGL